MSAMDQDGDMVPPPPGKAAETRIVKMDGRHKYIQWLLAVWDKQPGRPLPELPDDYDYLGHMHDDTRPSPDRAPPLLHRHLVLGSSCGWLAIADGRSKIYLVNPATGEQHALPHITTMGVFFGPSATGDDHSFCVQLDRFLTARYGCGPPFKDSRWGPDGMATFTLRAKEMRAYFYQKVVLSASPCPGSYTAMLILPRDFGAPAFATAEEPAWRLAPSRDGVEDAIHHDGKFYSVSYSGDVESWERDAGSGAFTSTAVAPRLVIQDKAEAGSSLCRKYLAAAPGGQLMVVLKYPERCACYVLEDDGQWKETRDISDIIPQFVGVNNVDNDKALAQYRCCGYAYVDVNVDYDDEQPYLKEDTILISTESKAIIPNDLRVPNPVLAVVHEPTIPAPYPGHLVLGSSCGWLASADDRAQIYLVNPSTGEQHALPHIATIGVLLPYAGDCFCFKIDHLLTARFGCGPPFKDHRWGPDGKGTLTLSAHQMRTGFYRKVVLSASPRPGSYTAMLIPHRIFGAPAFATAEEPAWRLALSREGIEDAIHHHGQFYSISYSGVVELWEHDAESGAFMSTAIAPRLDIEGSLSSCRKYLGATPRGRLMVVRKYREALRVHVLGADQQWKEIRNIGEID